ncbi:GNAT family N-acetyltransferase [Tissierella carlieri]|uniref:GNAT family N-acetyltransferase n=1 Tax=Tissierella carlieri TaxID=689904 RepID=A0ABT1S657_9FIRM|nr:GNAT family N-acetyltransferase [Tissierella carlieri]MCQ4921946.1 GNAT family N-acetyltransferase [Tissierella carlieri]
MNDIIIETERLYIKYWKLDYIDELYNLMSDNRVHRYTGDIAWTKEKTKEYIQFNINRESLSLDNFHGVVILKGSNEIIGLTGLNPYLVDQPEIEWQLGFEFWNKGYAAEIGKAVVQTAFKNSSIMRIYGMTNPKNIRSIKVMEKIGMSCIGIRDFRGEQNIFYEILR